MTCDICGPGDKKEVRPSRMIGRTSSGFPISCHLLECGHAWHRPGTKTGPSECTCPDYEPPARSRG